MRLFSETRKELKRQMTTKADTKISFKCFLIFLKCPNMKYACIEGKTEYWFCFGDDVFKIRDYFNKILLKLYKRHPSLIKGMFNYVMHNYCHDSPGEKTKTLRYDGISIAGQIATEMRQFNILRSAIVSPDVPPKGNPSRFMTTEERKNAKQHREELERREQEETMRDKQSFVDTLKQGTCISNEFSATLLEIIMSNPENRAKFGL